MKPSLSLGRLITVAGVISCVTLGTGHGFAAAQSPVGGNFAISTAPINQDTPALAFDGTNYLVVWLDSRTDARTGDIYGARVSSGGVVLDPSGFPISTAADWQQNVAIAFGGSNYLVVWEDYRAGTPQIYGARVTPGGQVLDGDGFIIASSATAQFNPAIAFDGVNFLVVWADTLGSGSVRGARVTPAGAVLDPGGVSVFTAPFASQLGFPSIAFDGSNYLVVHVFDRDILGTRVTPGAGVLGAFAISAVVPPGQPLPRVAFDGTNYLVVWCCNPQADGIARISGARVSRAGTVLDAPNLTLSSPPASPGNVRVAFASTSFLIAWDDGRGNIFGSYVSADGVATTPQGVQISNVPSGVPLLSAVSPAIGTSTNNLLVVWSDYRNDPGLFPGNHDIYGQLIGPNADDNFGGASLDPTRWSAFGNSSGNGTVTQQNGRLEVSLNAGGTTAGVQGKCFVGGDFDVQVDFALLNWPANNLQTIKLATADLGSGTFGLPGPGRFSGLIDSYQMVLLSSIEGLALTTDTGGKLRLTRSGTTLTGYYHNGTNFVALASATVPTVSTRFVLNVGSSNPSGAAVQVAYDNFRVNAGAVDCAAPPPPPPQLPVLSVTGGPLDFGSVTVGTSKDLTLTVANAGGGTLTGTATASAPFSIVGGSPFNLTSGLSQAVTVQFRPTSGDSFSSNVGVTSNGGTASVVVSGQGNRIPTITATLGSPGGSANPQGTIAEPVNTATGNYIFQRTDLAIPGRGLPTIFTRTYNSLDSYSGPLGSGWTHSYNIILTEKSDGSVVIKQGDGREEFYDPAGGGAYTPRFAGVFSTLVKNFDSTFTLTLKNQTRYRFSTIGKLTGMVDRNGNVLSFSYDGFGKLTAITDTVGRSISLSYDANQRITQLTDPIGRRIQYAYDGVGNLVAGTDASGGVMIFSYDASHRVIEIREEHGNRLLLNSYDASGRVVTQQNGRGFTTTFAFATPGAGDTTITDPRGNATVHTHDALRRLTKVTDPGGGQAVFTYDAGNNRTSITDQNGRTTLFAYDSRGNVLTITDPLGRLITFTYDAQNNLTTAANARGFTTTFSYDVPGNLTSIQDATGNTTAFTYNGFGQLSRKTDARGNPTQYGYDAQGNLTRITDALGGVTTLTYDGIGRLRTLTDPNGHTAGASYDANSRLTQIVDPLGNTTRFTFDAVGNLTQILDAKGNLTRYSYDEVNNLTTVTDPLGNITRYTYDGNNNRTGLVNANGRTATYVFDAINRLTRITDPLGHATAYLYDAVGNVRTVNDANGTTNTFVYDANNRLTSIAYGDGATVAYSYDANGNRVGMVDTRGTTTYAYDALDRLIQVIHPTGTVGYGYDAVGNRASLTYPDSGVVTYVYDNLNRLSRVSDREGQVTSYTYDAASNLLKVAYPNGTAISYQYDAANRLVTMTNTRGTQTLTSFAYTLDQLGNRLTKTTDGKLTSYSYDALSQLVSTVSKNQPQTNYTYDAVGNRLTSASGNQVTQFTYDAADRLLQAGKKSFTYDANGNRTSLTAGVVTTYTYDAANRLVRVVRGTDTAAYEYDGDGNKITQALGLDVFRFVNDVATGLPVVLAESGPSQNLSYVWGNALISQSALGAKSFYHYDGLGSVVALTDSLGNQSAVYAYDAWGAPEGSGNAAPITNRFRFTGEEEDDLTGLYYLRARWYDPSVGRFLNRDPLPGSRHNPLTLNRYTYALNNPTRFTDPNGRSVSDGSSANWYSWALRDAPASPYAWALINTVAGTAAEWLIEAGITESAAGLYSREVIGLGLPRLAGTIAAYIPLLGFVDPVTSLYRDVRYSQRDIVETLARSSIDFTIQTTFILAGTLGEELCLGLCTSLVIAEEAAYKANRESVQNRVLYNPITNFIGDKIYRVGRWIGVYW